MAWRGLLETHAQLVGALRRPPHRRAQHAARRHRRAHRDRSRGGGRHQRLRARRAARAQPQPCLPARDRPRTPGSRRTPAKLERLALHRDRRHGRRAGAAARGRPGLLRDHPRASDRTPRQTGAQTARPHLGADPRGTSGAARPDCDELRPGGRCRCLGAVRSRLRGLSARRASRYVLARRSKVRRRSDAGRCHRAYACGRHEKADSVGSVRLGPWSGRCRGPRCDHPSDRCRRG
jgi:hypothetical protein